MLHFADGRASFSKKWVISSMDLRRLGLRSPQGFSFKFGKEGNYFYTTNEFAAYLFHRRYNTSSSEVHEYFREREEREDYLYRLSFSTDSEIELKHPEGMDYRPYQKAGIEYCQLTGNVLIADEQRVGKTLVAIGTINNLKDVRKVLILCPKTAKLNWKAELDKWLIDDTLKVQVLSSQSQLDVEANIYVANYDILPLKPEIVRQDYDLVVADECHIVSRMDARRTKFFTAITAKKIIGLSGTPLMNVPKDLLTIAQWLDPFWKQFSFKNDYFISASGISLTLDEVQHYLRSSLMVRRVQAQVFENEPIEKRVVPLPIPDAARSALEIQLRELGDYAKVRKLIGLHKVPYALNHINVYSSEGEKLVVFAYHHDVIERLVSSLGSRAVCVYGNTSEKDREAARHRFNNDPTCTVFVGSIEAAGMAINLSVAHHIIFVEGDWKNWAISQALERCSDKDQKFPVLVEFLMFENEGSIDKRMSNKVDSKDAVVDRGIDMIYV